MYIEDLEWDERNVEHIGRHHITTMDVENVCYGKLLARNIAHRRYTVSGQAAAACISM